MLAYEPDIAAVMRQHPDLGALLLDQTEAKPVAESEALRQSLAELTQKLRKSEQAIRELLGALPAATVAVAGTGGVMVTLQRTADRPYRCTPGTVALADVEAVRALFRRYGESLSFSLA